ncbi:prolipoprotein diacylglyceryl transferase [Aerococcus suis]|uniref:Phosphatidylglycerol--prolipoprotein diacylglyceryl transferase n=1 Tax=Aerococcus suis TaxID=371602 RepID=A0A1W1Z967_9LACT|nr:prolipoprotein diacylglyceryl transferase [Aerococcus suis]MCI7239990.1 prolipoprotein diacylglyceryl transferase [Aerococcus suis]MDD7758579.1 prolipoprotein diacylglyceryl transferase [Aerococcus suis]MDY4646558.1 prolipoprotein diacylglyceryl transferase [Aerococcus suis]SMC44498.1 Prolipoprotein diacylglyceryl transferase [Aerococcus suis]
MQFILQGLANTINPVAFHLFGWPVYWYGVIIGGAILLAITLASREMRRKGFNDDFVLDLMIWAIPIGFLGARLYYVIFEWPYYLAHPTEIFAIWQGGIAIYGGVIAGALTVYFYSKYRGFSPYFILDLAAPYLLLAQSIGRWGNFVNGEAHGGPVSESFLSHTLHLPQFIVDGMLIDGTYYHPTFLYESLWNVLGVILLLILRRQQKTLKLGETTLLYLIWYAFGRFFIEGMRTDSLYLGPLRISQVLALVIFILGIGLIIWLRHRPVKRPYYSEISHSEQK